MPHLRVRGLNESAVKELSRSLPKELGQIFNLSEDNFTVEKIATTYYRNGDTLSDAHCDPMIEFLWFERGDDIRKAAARKTTELVSQHSKSEFIAVVFIAIPKENYFENGVHF